MNEIQAFFENPTHFQAAMFCYSCAAMMVFLDVQAKARRHIGNFRFEAGLAFVAGSILLAGG